MSTRFPEQKRTVRKEPKQARSRETVKAIREGAARVLSKRGWKGFNTNVVAEISGVGIGSIYQYFSDRESLVEAVRQAHFDGTLSVLSQVTESDGTVLELVHALIAGLLAVHEKLDGATIPLLDEVPREIAETQRHIDFEKEYLHAYALLLKRCCWPGTSRTLHKHALLVATVVENLVHGLIRGHLQTDKGAVAHAIDIAHAAVAYVAPSRHRDRYSAPS